MNNTIINKALIGTRVESLRESYHENLIGFSKLIEELETIIIELTTAQDAFILTVDESIQKLKVLSQDREIFIEDIEDTFSIILECYYTKEQHHVKNLNTSFLYNREFDKLVEYQLKDILVIPILDFKGDVAAIVWLTHAKKSDAIFSSIDFDNLKKFITLIQNVFVQRENIPASMPPKEDKKEMLNDASDQLRILIVDDDIIILKYLSAVLRQQDFHVEIAHSGIEALKAYKSSDAFDLIFMDEVMNGGMHGHQAVKKIREIEAYSLQKRIPILALTSDTSLATKQLLLDSGCDLVLHKPIDPEHILQTIAEISAQ